MSGTEIAGLVLLIVPLALSALQSYTYAAKRVDDFKPGLDKLSIIDIQLELLKACADEIPRAHSMWVL